MKKCVDGVVREMTPEEEAEHKSREYPFDPDPEPTVEDKAEAYDILTGVSE